MNYTLVLQNVISKDISVYNLEDQTLTGVYFKFEIELKDHRDGEYEYILFPNENMFPIEVCESNIFNTDFISPKILVTYNETLTTDTRIMCWANNTEIQIAAFGLLKIGDYKIEKLRYSKPSNYVVYERK